VNPYFETNETGTLSRERGCEWPRNDCDGIRRSSVEGRWSDSRVAITSWRCRRNWAFIDGCCNQWRDQSEAFESAESPPGSSRESTLRKESSQLQRVLAEKTLEVDFFKGALQKSRLDAGTAV